MLQSLPQALEVQPPRPLETTLMVIGGAEDKLNRCHILRHFWQSAGGEKAHIVILPCASREPAAIGDRYRQIFQDMGVDTIEVLNVSSRDQCSDPLLQNSITRCSGVFMTGGDQLRLCDILAETPLMEQVRSRATAGEIVLAGTSAGAAVMGQPMIAGGGSGESPNHGLVDMTLGLGIIPQLIIDQHFHNRNRMARLISAVSAYPNHLGIGIDEDTCAAFSRDGTFQVMGQGTVTIIDPEGMSHTNQAEIGKTDALCVCNLRVHVLSAGYQYNIHKRAVLHG